VNLSELNSEDGNGDRENQGTRSGEILEETSGNINSNEDTNSNVTIIEWRLTP
jgi:hypothetical protein